MERGDGRIAAARCGGGWYGGMSFLLLWLLLLLRMRLLQVLRSRPTLIRANNRRMCSRRRSYDRSDDIVCFSGVLPGAQGCVRVFKLHQVVQNVGDIAKIILYI